jgi:Holliday junction DNA helicase RuvA
LEDCEGTIAAIGEGQALIDVSGVGYLVHAGSRALGKLTVGEPAELFVETQMSESAIRLFAFVSGEERAWFARLQDAPGVGAKIALAILDTLTLPQLMDAIALADTTAISRANGVGKKLAERIVTEFKGKPPPMGLFASSFAARHPPRQRPSPPAHAPLRSRRWSILATTRRTLPAPWRRPRAMPEMMRRKRRSFAPR